MTREDIAAISPEPGGSLRKSPRPGEMAIRGFLFVCGAVSIAITIGILYELGKESLLFFQDERVSVVEFLTDTFWQPQAGRVREPAPVFGSLVIPRGAVL